jgi:hypothetical protein
MELSLHSGKRENNTTGEDLSFTGSRMAQYYRSRPALRALKISLVPLRCFENGMSFPRINLWPDVIRELKWTSFSKAIGSTLSGMNAQMHIARTGWIANALVAS